jgi:medium-chain acyl-[acyl-carrier-protein] hydrolase
MSEPALVWREAVRVKAWEVGAAGQVSVSALCNWLQEAAGNSATSLTWGIEELQQRSLTWVLARLHLEIGCLPSWRDEVAVETWPTGIHRVLAIRDFRVLRGDEPLVVATSGWVLVDTTSRRPVRPGATLAAMGGRTPPRALEDTFERLPEPTAASRSVTLRVGRSDLDMNGHANNVRFIAWALDVLPATFADTMTPASFELEFRAEAREGDVLLVEAAPAGGDPGVWLHRITRPDENRELARARSRWKPMVGKAGQGPQQTVGSTVSISARPR